MKLNYLYCLLAFLFMPLCIKAQDVKYLKYQGGSEHLIHVQH